VSGILIGFALRCDPKMDISDDIEDGNDRIDTIR
jgi:hypothetical protein